MDSSGTEKRGVEGEGPVGSESKLRRWRITVRGIVQGVGFRPFVYNTAQALGVRGWVKNTSAQVQLEIEADQATLEAFLRALQVQCPRQARIDTLEIEEIAQTGEGLETFQIISSTAEEVVRPAIPADLATCEACLAEIRSPGERRFRYPFTNCTHCGPRWSIIRGLPYDRPQTSMAHFVMCPACRAEYENPADRRFHAQPIACPACGPKLRLLMCMPPKTDSAGTLDPTGGIQPFGESDSVRGADSPGGDFFPAQEKEEYIEIAQEDEALVEAARAIRDGKILALKGLGGFQLLCDATRQEVVQRLRERKRRPEKPLALMFETLEEVRQVCEVCPAEAEVLQSPEAPIVLLRRRSCSGSSEEMSVGRQIAPGVAPGNPYLGVMLPYTPLHSLLLEEVGRPIVCTSGNLSEEPMAYRTSEAMHRLGRIADLMLTHNRPIVRPVDDSVVQVVIFDGPTPGLSLPREDGSECQRSSPTHRRKPTLGAGMGHVQMLRRARGYAPRPIELGFEVPPILALGGHLKNTVALAVGSQVVVSQHVGDLDNRESVEVHHRTVEDMLAFFRVQPEVVVCDLHPDYASTRYAEQLADRWKVPLVRVQHHFAHLGSCLAEQGMTPVDLAEPILGFSWDGTGYGLDGTVWGGEMLSWQAGNVFRVGTLRSFPFPGGDRAVREPRRSALGVLYEILGEAAFERLPDWFRPTERRGLASMLRRGVNTPRASSMGRLFDAVAALCGLGRRITFEGQAAMALEFAASNTACPDEHVAPYPLSWTEEANRPMEGQPEAPDVPLLCLDWEPMLRAILADQIAGVPVAHISRRFHETLAHAILWGTQWAAHRWGIRQVGLSGGCFQNSLLTQRAYARLNEAGFHVHLHQEVPPGDGGIALGQIFLGAWQVQPPISPSP